MLFPFRPQNNSPLKTTNEIIIHLLGPTNGFLDFIIGFGLEFFFPHKTPPPPPQFNPPNGGR
jgi:hypothetical protein